MTRHRILPYRNSGKRRKASRPIATAATLVFVCLCAARADANSVLLVGIITQSVQEGGAPAVANPSLNNVADGDQFAVTFDFMAPISSPGSFDLGSLTFTDLSAGVSESGFISGSMTLTQSGASTQFDVLGCLISASSCSTGNQLTLDFQMPTSQIAQSGVEVQPVPSLLMADLLEDNGATDIHGLLETYSYTGPAGPAQTPEPSTAALILLGAIGLFCVGRRPK